MNCNQKYYSQENWQQAQSYTAFPDDWNFEETSYYDNAITPANCNNSPSRKNNCFYGQFVVCGDFGQNDTTSPNYNRPCNNRHKNCRDREDRDNRNCQRDDEEFCASNSNNHNRPCRCFFCTLRKNLHFQNNKKKESRQLSFYISISSSSSICLPTLEWKEAT